MASGPERDARGVGCWLRRGAGRRGVAGCRMGATVILTDVALLLLVLALWDDMRAGGRLEPRRRTWLLTAGIFALAGIVTTLLR